MEAFRFWVQCRGIRTRQGAELRKREAFSSAAREERSDEAGRGRRQPHAGIPHRPPPNWKRSSQGDRSCLRPSQGDSNPQGCGAEETRKRFPAQHARSGATKRDAGGASRTRTSLIAHHRIGNGPRKGTVFVWAQRMGFEPASTSVTKAVAKKWQK